LAKKRHELSVIPLKDLLKTAIKRISIFYAAVRDLDKETRRLSRERGNFKNRYSMKLKLK
jgi:hypothetical protein